MFLYYNSPIGQKANVNIYCDESRYSNPFEQYFVIGGLWLPRQDKNLIDSRLKAARRESGFNPELKWGNITEAKLPYLNELLQIFFTSDLNFRCIIIDKAKLRKDKDKKSATELSFYKFYYLMLRGMLQENTKYYIFLDERNNESDRRIGELEKYLNAYLGKKNSELGQLQPIRSEQSMFIQLSDLLMGAVGYYWNGFRGSSAKMKFINNLTSRLEVENLKFASKLYDRKWNQFVWEPK